MTFSGFIHHQAILRWQEQAPLKRVLLFTLASPMPARLAGARLSLACMRLLFCRRLCAGQLFCHSATACAQ